MTAHSIAGPVLYHPSYEKIQEDEQQTIQELIDTLQSISDKTAHDHGHAFRSVHVKSHGLLRGKLRVEPNLPRELKQGIFASDSTYPVVIRLSTSPGDFLDDSVSTPRGFALKVIGVQGERLQGDPADNTQDFLLVSGPAFVNKDAKSFLAGLKLLAKTTDKASGLKKVISAILRFIEKTIESLGGESAKIKSMGGYPETHILGERFFTQVPVLYGPYMAKFSIRPASPALMTLIDKTLDTSQQPDALRQAVNTFFSTSAAEWQVLVQLCRNIETMPIEDASVVWPEDESPYLKVASLMVEPQTAWDESITPRIEDRLAFSPWNGIVAHRPLGSVMRSRQHTYKHSSDFRRRFNGCPLADIRSEKEL